MVALVAASTHSAGEVRCVAPPHGATGWVGVELVSLDETVGGGSFFYEARATVSLVLPLLGPVEGGSRLTVLGSHFRESSALACRFGHGSGAVAVAARLVSAAQLECVSPVVPGASARAVEVSSNGQQFSTGGAAFTYARAAAVSAVWPVQGSAEGGTPLTVYGSGFTAASESLGYLQCRLNATVVRGQLLGDGTGVVCRSAAVAAGYVAVEVSTNGLDFTADGVQYESVWSAEIGRASCRERV